MKKVVEIAIVEPDARQVDEVKRFLKPGSESFRFSINHFKSIDDFSKVEKGKNIGALLLNAELVKDSADFEVFNTFIKKMGLPIVLFSNSINTELRDKADKVHASDFMVNNKLNLYYLPRTLESLLRLPKHYTDNNAELSTLDQIPFAVITFEHQEVKFFNAKARIFLEKTVLSSLQNFALLEATSFPFSYKENDYQVYKAKQGTQTTLFFQQRIDSSTEIMLSITKAVEHYPLLIFKNDLLFYANKKANQVLIDVDLHLSFAQLFSVSMNEGEPRLIHRSSKNEFAFTIESLTVSDKEYQLLTLQDLHADIVAVEKFPMKHLINAFSHDLKEPVRTSLNYLQLLGSKVKGDQSEYVSIISSEMKRMDLLLRNLKMSLSVDEEEFQFTPINIRSVLESVFKQLKPVIDEADAMIDLSTMPTVNADVQKIELVFYHLVENALKFRKKDKRCFIEILAEKKDNTYVFCVKDNGVGIDERFHQDIFKPFYRHGNLVDNPANGLGLNICKAVIERHHGKIWVESHEGFGSSFFFTLPD